MEEAEISLDIERVKWERERRDSGRDREKEEPREGERKSDRDRKAEERGLK